MLDFGRNGHLHDDLDTFTRPEMLWRLRFSFFVLQTASRAYPTGSVLQTLKAIYNLEGVRGLWRGNWSSVVRIFPYAAAQV